MPDLYGHLTPQGVLNGSLQTIVYANNYNDLINKPSINSVELQGNKTAADLGLLTAGDIPVDSVNGKQGVVILDGDDIEYEAGTSVNSKITDLEAEISSGPVISVNGQQGVVELDGTDINYSLSKTLNQKIDEVEAEIPVVSYPVTSVNTKTGDVVLDGDDIDYAEGVTVNDQIDTLMQYIPVYGNTASGAIATFDTSLALPLQDCTIEINAVQSVSGTPSPDNVRPITGFSSANVSRCGKNFFENMASSTTINGVTFTVNDDGTITANGTATADAILRLSGAEFINNYKRGTFILNGCPTGGSGTLYAVDSVGTEGYDYGNGLLLVPLNNSDHNIRCIVYSGYTANNLTFKPMIRLATETDKTFEAYNGTIYNIAFTDGDNPLTVYGGLLDVTTGVLTVTHSIVDFGTLTWNKNTSFTNTLFVANVSGKKANNSNCLCTNYTNGGIATGGTFLNNMQNNNFASDASNGIYIRDDSKASLSGDDFKTAMSGVYLVYELATPQTHQLTPTQISAIVGTNNIFTDTNGDTSVVYACSLKDYIDSQ